MKRFSRLSPHPDFADCDEVEKVLACPYCLEPKTGSELGCCGEGRNHFEYLRVLDDGSLSE